MNKKTEILIVGMKKWWERYKKKPAIRKMMWRNKLTNDSTLK